MRVTCPICQGPHAKWDCKAPESTAARMDVRASAQPQQPTDLEILGARNLAGTQALPVDTNPESSVASLDSYTHGLTETPLAGTGEDTDRQPKFDKVAYQREYMRKWRASRVKPT